MSNWAMAAVLAFTAATATATAGASAPESIPPATVPATVATTPVVATSLEIESPDEVMALPADLRERLHREVLSGSPPPPERLERLIRFLFDPQGLGMSYQEDATHSVARSYATRKANCVGFTLLFLALARESGLEARAQGIRQTLSWRRDDSTLYRNSHVNARVRVGRREYTVDFAVAPVIARNAPTPQSDQRLLAQYYNNLAMQDLERKDMAAAQQRMAIALRLDPAYSTHWSNAGVMHLRNGEVQTAEHAYARALSIDPWDAGALFNMAGLARRTGDLRREREYQRRLARVQQQDPLHHFLQAIAFEQSGDYAQAIAHYQRAIRLYSNEPRFHAALAGAYRLVGDERRAAKAQSRANALEADKREAYRKRADGLGRATH